MKLGCVLLCCLVAVLAHAGATDVAAGIERLQAQIETERQALFEYRNKVSETRQANHKSLQDLRRELRRVATAQQGMWSAVNQRRQDLRSARTELQQWKTQRQKIVEILNYQLSELGKLYPLLQGVSGPDAALLLPEQFAAAAPLQSGGETLHEAYASYLKAATLAVRTKLQTYDQDGEPREAESVRVGLLGGIAVDDGLTGVLQLSPAGGLPTVVSRLPVAYRKVLDGAMQADPVPVVLDVSGGMALESLQRRKTFRDYFKAGGIVMYPLAAIALLALLMLIERGIVYYRLSRGHARTFGAIAGELKSGTAKAVVSIKQAPAPMARLWTRGVEALQRRGDDVEETMQEAIIAELPGLEKHLSTLAVFAAIAPLLGLLGTVGGMIKTFEVITQHGTGNARLLADGISEALVTTQVGLAIAIPLLLLHAVLSRQAKKIVANMEQLALIVLSARVGKV